MLKPLNLFALLIISTFYSCSSVYMPNVPNTPMLSAKGEFSGGAHISMRGNANFNGAYALTNHLGVLMGAAYMNNERKRKDLNYKLVEAGAGYFTTLGSEKNRVLEIYAGLGKGSTSRIYREYESGELFSTELQVTDYNKKFLQVNYSSKKNRNLHLFGNDYQINYGTAIRVSHITMADFYLNGMSAPKEDNVFIEPVFFTRMRLSKAVQLQYTTSSNFGLKNRKYMTAGNSIFSIGAVINVGGK